MHFELIIHDATCSEDAGDYEAVAESIEVQLLADCEAARGDRGAILRAMRRARLASVRLSIAYADGPDAELDRMIAALIRNETLNDILPYTASLDAARSFVSVALPGFWVSSGICGLTGQCSLGPDYHGPQRLRLLIEWPISECPESWSDDLAPGDARHRECYAILSCAVQALINRQERGF